MRQLIIILFIFIFISCEKSNDVQLYPDTMKLFENTVFLNNKEDTLKFGLVYYTNGAYYLPFNYNDDYIIKYDRYKKGYYINDTINIKLNINDIIHVNIFSENFIKIE